MFEYPPDLRIRKKAEYDAVLAREQRASDSLLTLFSIRNGFNYSRFGMIVSKKHGNAVKRNRCKRLLREAIRLHRQELPVGLDVVIIPKPQERHTLDLLVISIKALMKKLDRRLKSELP